MADPAPERALDLVARQEVRGSLLHVTFRCPVTNLEVRTVAPVTAGQAARRRRAAVPGGPFPALRRALSATLETLAGAPRALLGQPAAGRAQGASPEDVEAATLEAFDRVRAQFSWDARSNRWVGANALLDLQTGFSRILAASRIEHRRDRDLLLRMLVEVAGADGTFGAEERELLAAFTLDDALDDRLDDLARRPPLSEGELGRASPEARDVLLMLAWAVAWTDRDLSAAESARLATFARGLGVDPEREARLAAWAREQVLDHLLEAVLATDDAAGRAEVAALARRMGHSDADLARAEARCRRRMGLPAPRRRG